MMGFSVIRTNFRERDLFVYATRIGLDAAGFRSCMAGRYRTKVTDQASMAAKAGFTGAPSFLIGAVQANGTMKASASLQGARPAKEF